MANMNGEDKPVVWLHGEVKTPPFTQAARLEAGLLLRRLQQGESIRMPHSRALPRIGAHCHELRIRDENKNWRIIYRVDDDAIDDAIVVAEVFNKTTREIPNSVIESCQRRLSKYDDDKE